MKSRRGIPRGMMIMGLGVLLSLGSLVPTTPAAAAERETLPFRCTLAAHQGRDLGRGAVPTTTVGRIAGKAPVVWTTPAMLRRARDRVVDGTEPYASQWQLTRDAAEAALTTEYVPYQGPDRFRYFDTAVPQAQAARNLAITWRLTDDTRYRDKATEILLDWAIDGQTNSYPGSDLPHAAGLAIGRSMSTFADAYAITFEAFSGRERRTVDAWFANLVDPIMESTRIWREDTLELPGGARFEPPFLDQQYFNNHLGTHVLGLAAIGFVTGDVRLTHWALADPRNIRNLECLINGAILMPGDFGSGGEGDVYRSDPSLTDGAPAPLPGEIYDRYRVVEGAGQVYAMEHLRLLTLVAEMAYNNRFGRNWFSYTGAGGENLGTSFDLYADFFITGDEGSVNDGYYLHERGLGVPWTYLHYYELAARHYPELDRIRRALCNDHVPRSTPRNNESLGRSPALLYGPDLDCS